MNMPVFKEGSSSFVTAVAAGVIVAIVTVILGFLVSNTNDAKAMVQHHGEEIAAMKVTELAMASTLSDIRRTTEDKINSIEQTQVSISGALEALKEASIASNTTQAAELSNIKNQMLDVRKTLGDLVDFWRPIRTSPSGH
jgi:hypothetical protein